MEEEEKEVEVWGAGGGRGGRNKAGSGGGGTTAATVQHISNMSLDTLTGAHENRLKWRLTTGRS